MCACVYLGRMRLFPRVGVCTREFTCVYPSLRNLGGNEENAEVGGAAASRGRSLLSPVLSHRREKSKLREGKRFPKGRQWRSELEASVLLG